MRVNVYGGEMAIGERAQYVAMAKEKYGEGCEQLDISIDGDEVDLVYHITPFERIRRITGYLTGTVGRWNNAKRAELHDRVKHDKV